MVRLTVCTNTPEGNIALIPAGSRKNTDFVKAGMRIILKVYCRDTNNQDPQWGIVRSVQRQGPRNAILSLMMDLEFERKHPSGDYYSRFINDFHISQNNYGTHWCVYSHDDEDVEGNEMAMDVIMDEEDELVDMLLGFWNRNTNFIAHNITNSVMSYM